MKAKSNDKFTITAEFPNGTTRTTSGILGLDVLAKLVEYKAAGAKSIRYTRDPAPTYRGSKEDLH